MDKKISGTSNKSSITWLAQNGEAAVTFVTHTEIIVVHDGEVSYPRHSPLSYA